jgi:hypothetical protein
MEKPRIYLTTDEHSVTVSNYPAGHEKFETNSLEVFEGCNGVVRNKASGDITANILRNILTAAGCEVIIDMVEEG